MSDTSSFNCKIYLRYQKDILPQYLNQLTPVTSIHSHLTRQQNNFYIYIFLIFNADFTIFCYRSSKHSDVVQVVPCQSVGRFSKVTLISIEMPMHFLIHHIANTIIISSFFFCSSASSSLSASATNLWQDVLSEFFIDAPESKKAFIIKSVGE